MYIPNRKDKGLKWNIHYELYNGERFLKKIFLKDICPPLETADIWCADFLKVRHAGGALDGYHYLNSLECIRNSIECGYDTIELDFYTTKDGKFVLLHDFQSVWEVDRTEVMYKEFMSRKIKNKYTPVDLDMVLDLMQKHESLKIITDTGNVVELVRTLREACGDKENLLNRFIIQLYNYRNYIEVDSIYHFEKYIFTLYATGLYIWNFDEIVKFCLKNGISVVTMPYTFVIDKKVLNVFKHYGIKVLVHTVNEESVVNELMNRGVSGVYTDLL